MKRISRILTLMVFAYLLLAGQGFAEIRCVNTSGEAAIINNDIYSAKEEAIMRAKWGAIEDVTDMEVKGERIVQNNMRIVDEAVIKKFNGIIKQFEVLQVKEIGGAVKVLLKVCVETPRARQAIASLAMNNSLVVFVPAQKPRWCEDASGYEEANIFTETLMELLTERGYSVYDILPASGTDTRELENTLSGGTFLTFRNIMYRHLSNVLIIGKINHSRAKLKGEDIGYGLTMPSNHVKAKLTYRILKKDESGRMAVLTAGVETGKGFGATLSDAASDSLRDLAEKAAPAIASKLQRQIAGIAKKILVKVENINDLDRNFEVKGILRNIAWVTEVEEKALGEFVVGYTENSVYLANSMVQKETFRLVNFSTDSITVAYEQ